MNRADPRALNADRSFFRTHARLSINQMAEFVLDDAGQNDVSNTKSRFWAPSRSVIHLAAAAATVGQELSKEQALGMDDILGRRELIEAIVRRAELYEGLIEKERKIPVEIEGLIKVASRDWGHLFARLRNSNVSLQRRIVFVPAGIGFAVTAEQGDCISNRVDHSTSSTAPQDALTLSYLPLSALKPDLRNARIHSKKQVGQIAQSIESFGFNVPILIDGASNVVAGHGRLLAAKKLGWTKVPTIRLDHLTETQRRAFMIADNRLTEIGAWDDRLLAEQLKDLSIVDLTFDIETTGFDAPQIDLMIASLTLDIEAASDEKPLPCLSGPPVSRAGDIWALGRHKVLCGDATDAASYANLIGSEEVAVVHRSALQRADQWSCVRARRASASPAPTLDSRRVLALPASGRCRRTLPLWRPSWSQP
jgi:hypothetical protein